MVVQEEDVFIEESIRLAKLNAYKLREADKDNIGDVSEFEEPTYWTNKVLQILKERGIRYTINPRTGLYDIDGGVNLKNCKLESFGNIKFGVVDEFDCSYNRLISLEGCPRIVKRNFYCYQNKLTSLDYLPQIGGGFDCSSNNLASLKGCPQKVNGQFDCSNNYLTSLKYSPQKIDGGYNCRENKLITLEGAPEQINGYFDCSDNQLSILTNAPRLVGGYFNCSNNKLTSLEGSPRWVEGDFYCSDNQLITLKGAPDFVGDSFSCIRNPNLKTLGDIKIQIRKRIYTDTRFLKNKLKALQRDSIEGNTNYL